MDGTNISNKNKTIKLDTDKQNIKADCKTNTKQEIQFKLNENNNKYKH
jgi:hypothetical protein